MKSLLKAETRLQILYGPQSTSNPFLPLQIITTATDTFSFNCFVALALVSGLHVLLKNTQGGSLPPENNVSIFFIPCAFYILYCVLCEHEILIGYCITRSGSADSQAICSLDMKILPLDRV